MDFNSLNEVGNEHRKCLKAYGSLQSRDPVEIMDAWADFLDHFDKFLNKFKKATDKGSTKDIGWAGRIFGTVRKDPILNYMRHARNSETHGVERNTNEALKIGFVVPPHGKVNVAQTKAGIQISHSNEVDVHAEVIWSLKVISVKTEDGTEIHPPENYGNIPMPSQFPIFYAFHAMCFIDQTFGQLHRSITKRTGAQTP